MSRSKDSSLASECFPQEEDEKEQGYEGNYRANSRNYVSFSVGIRVVRVSSRYPCKAQEVLREEGYINTNKY